MQIDSRRVTPGALFVCMPGTTSDSHSYLPAAKAAGAIAAIVHSAAGVAVAQAQGLAVALLSVDDFPDSLWRLCDTFFDHPTRGMKVVGVTGTNGKTTTAWLIRDMLRAMGLKAGYLGTLGFHLPDEERELNNTTPFAVELYNLLAEARDQGVQALAMEVSSHALDQRRVDGVEFDAAVFTNLTQDHLDFHGTMEAYEAAKLRLFTDLPKQTAKPFVAAINVDDPVGYRWAYEKVPYPSIAYGAEGDGLGAEPLDVAIDHIDLRLFYDRQQRDARVSLGGSFNYLNTVSAIAGMLALRFAIDEILRVLPQVRPVPGRFEAVSNHSGIGILVDYAHTPDALEKLLEAARPLTKGRVLTVFGCGGDRDRSKRPLMARAASERSDVTVVTSDNPRTEDPQSIVDEVLTGIAPGRDAVAVLDRREAVAHAVKMAQPGDVVVIAGKGHENYQILGRTKTHMDDRELAREALAAR